MIDWDEYRREDSTIDLKKAFSGQHQQGTMTMAEWALVVQYLRAIERLQLINSRQAAAIILVQATNLVLQHRGRL